MRAQGPIRGWQKERQEANETQEGKEKNSHFLARPCARHIVNSSKDNNKVYVRWISAAFLVFPLPKEDSCFKLLFIDIRERERKGERVTPMCCSIIYALTGCFLYVP